MIRFALSEAVPPSASALICALVAATRDDSLCRQNALEVLKAAGPAYTVIVRVLKREREILASGAQLEQVYKNNSLLLVHAQLFD